MLHHDLRIVQASVLQTFNQKTFTVALSGPKHCQSLKHTLHGTLKARSTRMSEDFVLIGFAVSLQVTWGSRLLPGQSRSNELLAAILAVTHKCPAMPCNVGGSMRQCVFRSAILKGLACCIVSIDV